MAKFETSRSKTSTKSRSKSAPRKSAAKKVQSSKKSSAARKKTPIALSVEEKQRKLKPLTGFSDLVERLVHTWKEHGRKVKVPSLSPARLASLLRAAARASKREDALRVNYESKLQPLADARLRAEHDVWKNALDLYAMVKTAARTDPAILAPFEFFAEALAKRRAGSTAPARTEQPGTGGESPT